jgi:membrane protease YdiL (CAAX protease family)
MALVLISGAAFGLAHIVFNNWVAPVLCAVGGVLFAHTYHKTRSLALVCLEHALYGDFVFTVGLGRYFYHGAVGASS